MKFSLAQIANVLQAELVGDPELEITGLSPISEGKPGTLTFLANPKYLPHLYTTQATAVIVKADFEPQRPLSPALLKVKDPYGAFTRLLEEAERFSRPPQRKDREQPHYVASDAEVAEDAYLGAFSYIGSGAKVGKGAQIFPQVYVGEGVEIGEGSIIYPQVCLYPGTRIGKNCIVHAGACLGSDGFGFAPTEDGSYRKIPQLGKVVVEDEVEIGANTTIDRATMGDTIIRKGAKLDNLVQIAHNVDIGSHTVIAAQTGIAGSTRLHEQCMVGGQVGIVGHLELAKGSKIDAQSGVNRSIREEGKAFRGSPIQPHRDQLRSEVLFRKLHSMYAHLQELEKRLKEMEGKG
jgi:UDP-3-O-[3-hydroxymyristoyl] glucosamine N-acyltransferase